MFIQESPRLTFDNCLRRSFDCEDGTCWLFMNLKRWTKIGWWSPIASQNLRENLNLQNSMALVSPKSKCSGKVLGNVGNHIAKGRIYIPQLQNNGLLTQNHNDIWSRRDPFTRPPSLLGISSVYPPHPVRVTKWRFKLGFLLLKMECRPGGDWHPAWGVVPRLSQNLLEVSRIKKIQPYALLHLKAGRYIRCLEDTLFECVVAQHRGWEKKTTKHTMGCDVPPQKIVYE